MKLERTRNAKKNIITGMANKIIMILLPFAVQTTLIRTLGADYNGLKGVFSSILQVLSLAELGIGNALVFGMYKPIADDDIITVCRLLNLYKKVYKWIGLFILVMGIVLAPFTPYLIKGNHPPEINVVVLFFMYLINTVLSYWLYAYKASLFNAFQRVDIINLISTGTQALCYLLQIFILIKFKSYYAFFSVSILATIINNLILSYEADKMYPEYKCYGTVSKQFLMELKEKIKGLIVYKFCNISRNSFDNIFLSIFLGLRITGMYNNYYYILTSVSGIMSIISTSLLAGVGNSIASETVEKNYADMRRLNFIYMLITGWGSIFMVCLYQPFMKLWVGKDLMFPESIAGLFALYFYIMKMGDIRAIYSDAKGLWWENRYRTIFETIINLILNFILIQVWGVHGIIIATMLPLFLLGFIGSALVLFRHYFQNGFNEFIRDHGIYFFVTSLVCFVTFLICKQINYGEMIDFFLRLLMCGLIPPILYFLIYRKSKIYNLSIEWLLLRIRGH